LFGWLSAPIRVKTSLVPYIGCAMASDQAIGCSLILNNVEYVMNTIEVGENTLKVKDNEEIECKVKEVQENKQLKNIKSSCLA
jgi:hypothetical protein